MTPFRRRVLLAVVAAAAIAAGGTYFVQRSHGGSNVDRTFEPGVLERRLFVGVDDGKIHVYDIDEGHRHLGRIRVRGAEKFKGIAASVPHRALYVTSRETDQLVCLDLITHEERWRRNYGDYLDSLAVTADGETLYVPARDGVPWRWYVLDARSGDVKTTIEIDPTAKDPRYKRKYAKERGEPPWTSSRGPHNTVCGPTGERMYLEAMQSPYVYIADVATHSIVGQIGPFSAGVRPFAVFADESRIVASVDGLLGFEIGAVRAEDGSFGGPMIESLKARPGQDRRREVGKLDELPHNTPTHGVAIRPNQREVWVVDGAHGFLHVFDATVDPPKQIASVALFDDQEDRPDPGWISFSLDGSYAYSGTGHVVDADAKRVVTRVEDSERVIEIDFRDGLPIAAAQR